DSQEATNVLQRQFPSQAGDADQIVLHDVNGKTITDPAVRDKITRLLARVDRLPHVTGVVSPYPPQGAANVSADRTTAFAVVTFDANATALPTPAINRVIHLAPNASTSTLQVELGWG